MQTFETLAEQNSVRRLLAGGMAGVTSTCLTYPLDVWNTRMAVAEASMKYKEVCQRCEEYHPLGVQVVSGWRQSPALWHKSVSGGRWSARCYHNLLWGRTLIRTQYSGLTLTVLGMFPYASISFCTFETLKRNIQQRQGKRELSPAVYLVCGGTAGVLSQTATYPLDTVRKHMQTHHFLREMRSTVPLEPGPKAKGIIETVKHVYRARGVRGFYNGVTFNWMKGFCAPGLSFMLHEVFNNTIAKN
eukprot:Selendium_serpulae@DN4968_c0_g1_i4.p1